MLFISTPCYGGLCIRQFAESMFRLQKKCADLNIPVYVDFTENESLVQRARNIAVARFLKSPCTSFMFIDADIHFEADSVIRLFKSPHDITVGAYPKKTVMWDQVLHGESNKKPETLAASLALNFGIGKTHATITNGFVEVLDGATGFMMIKRHVVEKMYEKYPELNCINDHQFRDLDEYCAIFDCMIDPETKRYLSEDYAFCRRWQQMGGLIHLDVTAVLGHVGNIRFPGSIIHRIKTE